MPCRTGAKPCVRGKHPPPKPGGPGGPPARRGIAIVAVTLLLALLLFLPRLSTVHAQTATAATPAPATGPLADLLSGKTFPASLKSEQYDSTFHLVDLVDLQGKAGTYATRGAVVTIGSETYLAAYPVLFAPGSRSKALFPGAGGDLALINLHSVQAMLNIRDVPPVGSLGGTPPVTTGAP